MSTALIVILAIVVIALLILLLLAAGFPAFSKDAPPDPDHGAFFLFTGTLAALCLLASIPVPGTEGLRAR
jgi:hypothetical protein